VTANVNLNTVFFTGSLYTRIDARRNDVGTVTGQDARQVTLSNVYYAYVAYRNTGGAITYTAVTPTGQMGTLVPGSASALPNATWWSTYYALLVAGNANWAQDGTGRPYLNI